MTDDFDPRGAAEAVPEAVVPEPRRAPENDFPAEHIVLGYN
ncbi:hypothetical protein ACFORH_42455 [Amycolatopsis roodepoortensis]|uniref:Uncharacterized protein n=1 Tax=Amycolatopsis roodepoortensis TaxID=700274 RepID=A0ABR9LEQ5_9PSEU|nr:hypothetical protein [Amycolatopsis roodepoortensis]MBE1579149.1 hypothetical protein [Amycolatopsis roodepoortensis]